VEEPRCASVKEGATESLRDTPDDRQIWRLLVAGDKRSSKSNPRWRGVLLAYSRWDELRRPWIYSRRGCLDGVATRGDEDGESMTRKSRGRGGRSGGGEVEARTRSAGERYY
jgi:hypothetical protein